jgi:transcriptional regulator with XRE-family HTH domain
MGFGKNLELSLKYHNISVAELSRRTGISLQTLYSTIRRDSNKIDMESLQKIEEAIGDPEFPLSSAAMDFSNVLEIYVNKFQKKLPDGYALHADADSGTFWLEYPTGAISKDLSQEQIQNIVDDVLEYMAYRLDKLRNKI